MKYCTGCNTSKDYTEFNKNKAKGDGYGNYCRACMRGYYNSRKNTLYMKERRQGNPSQSGSRFHNCHSSMMARCYNKKSKHYPHYGGRGIEVCEKWRTFQGFMEDMLPSYKDGLTLERVDVNGNYCKENCCWITKAQQAWNKTNTIYVTDKDGSKLNMLDVSKKYGLSLAFLKGRYSRHVDNIDEITKPRELAPATVVPETVKMYVWENRKTLTTPLLRVWLDKNYPDLTLRDQYIRQLLSDYKTGRKTFKPKQENKQ
jgi:hypothetical protein